MNIVTIFDIGQEVKFRGYGSAVRGMIIAVLVIPAGVSGVGVKYEVAYWRDNVRRTIWMSGIEIEALKKDLCKNGHTIIGVKIENSNHRICTVCKLDLETRQYLDDDEFDACVWRKEE